MNCLYFLLFVYVLHLFQVIVSSRSFILQPDNPLIGVYKSSITFHWKASGPIYYRNWKFGGDIIAQVNAFNETVEQINVYPAYRNRITFPFSSPVLTLKNLSFTDIGKYSCEVILNDGQTEESFTFLKVFVYPTFIDQPTLYSSVEYNDVNISCTASSRPALKNLTWIHNGGYYPTINKQILLSKQDGMLSRSTGLLMLHNVSRYSHGEYRCIAEHDFGPVNTTISLLVNFPPQLTRFPVRNIVSIENSHVSIQCDATGYPLPAIYWYKDNKRLNRTNSHYQITSTNITRHVTVENSVHSSLLLRNVTHADFGYYMCEAVNVLYKEGEVRRSRSIYVFVRYPPVLLVNSTTRNVSEKSTNGFEISCKSRGYPPITEYVWSKDGINMFHNKSVYRVNEVNITYQGTYKCRAENSEGTSETVSHVITVLVSPGISLPATCYPDRGMLYCSCAGFGNPPIEIYWTKSPSDVILSNQHTLNISINLNVSGIYICHLKNQHGTTKSAHHITALHSMWSSWNRCNATCGQGYRFRNRTCLVPPCQGPYAEWGSCSASVCPVVKNSAQLSWHKDWYIILWVLIPIMIILILIFVLWVARKNSNTHKAIIVSSNRSTADVPPSIRNIQTRPDIYLPNTPNTFSAINNGYMVDEREKKDKESMEVVMYLAEDCNNSSIWFSPPHNSPMMGSSGGTTRQLQHSNSIITPSNVTVSPYNKQGHDERYMEVLSVDRPPDLAAAGEASSSSKKEGVVDLGGDQTSTLTDDVDGSVYL